MSTGGCMKKKGLIRTKMHIYLGQKTKKDFFLIGIFQGVHYGSQGVHEKFRHPYALRMCTPLD